MHKPSWFSNDHVMVSTAPTCGLTKGGRLLHKVDPATAVRVQEVDPEAGALVDAVNDRLLEDMQALASASPASSGGVTRLTDTLSFIPVERIDVGCAVPTYYDRRYHEHFQAEMKKPEYADHIKDAGRLAGGRGYRD